MHETIFSNMMKHCLEVFIDDFSIFGISYDDCLDNIVDVLRRHEETNLVLNWEKYHFMVQEGIVIRHKVSKKGLEVDHAKAFVIEQLPPPTSLKGVKNFLGHMGFYRRFIKDFSKIAKPLYKLLEKNAQFSFDDECQRAFEELKKRLVSAPVIVTLN